MAKLQRERRTEFVQVANEIALTASVFNVVCCIGGLFSLKFQYGILIYGLPISLLLIVFEYARSKRLKGRAPQRPGQRPIAEFWRRTKWLASNCYLRALIIFLFGVPLLFNIWTVCGALCLIYAAALYTVAGWRAEKWVAPDLPLPSSGKGGKTIEPPNKPAPRLTVSEVESSASFKRPVAQIADSERGCDNRGGNFQTAAPNSIEITVSDATEF